MELSRQIRLFSLFGMIALAVLLFGRSTSANTYETSLLDVLRDDGRFTTYVGALEQTGLDQMLAFNGDFTIFAPTDAAFAQLPPATRDAAFSDTNTLRQLLLHHMLLSKWQTNVIGGWDVAHSIVGKQIEVSFRSGALYLDDARVIEGDVVADNGLIHVVNQVLIPPTGAFNSNQHTQQQGSQPAPQPQPVSDNSAVDGSGTIYEVISADARFTTLVSAAQNAGLTQLLDKNGPFTLFAPTNAAFNALPAGTLDALMADKTAIRQLILHHMAQGNFDSDRLEKLTIIRTAFGQSVTVEYQNGVPFIDGVRVTIADIETGKRHDPRDQCRLYAVTFGRSSTFHKS